MDGCYENTLVSIRFSLAFAETLVCLAIGFPGFKEDLQFSTLFSGQKNWH